MSIQDFRELRVWQAGIDLVEQVYRLTACFPHEEIYGLTSQLRRAAVSVPANIAEGHTREHTREFLNFLSIGQASLAELETLITISMRLNYVADAEACRLLESVHSLGRQLYSLRNALQARHDETIPTAGPRPLTPDPHD